MKIPIVIAATTKYASGESYSATYGAGKITVRGSSDLATLAGKSQLSTSAAAGTWSEYLGECTPRFRLRPLWIAALPSMDFDQLATRLIALGFNALVTSAISPDLHAVMKSRGIKLIATDARPKLPADYVLHQATKNPPPDHLTASEAVQKELGEVEKKNGSVIFAVEEGEWLPELCDAAGPNSFIAFSGLAGNPRHLHLPPNRFWSYLRSHPICTQTPLLGIVNVGSVGMGSGEWPLIPFDLYDRCFSAPAQANFLGMIIVTDMLPDPGSFHECALWTSGMLQWHGRTPDQLLATWFKANRPEIDYDHVRPHLKLVYEIAVDLSAFQHPVSPIQQRCEKWQKRLDHIQASLNRLESDLCNESHSVSPSGLGSSVTRFINDSKQIFSSLATRHELTFRSRA